MKTEKQINFIFEKAMQKWTNISNRRLYSPCAFCWDADSRYAEWLIKSGEILDCYSSVRNCDFCMCDPAICGNWGHSGFINYLHDKYGSRFIYQLPAHEIDRIQFLFLEAKRKCLADLEMIPHE